MAVDWSPLVAFLRASREPLLMTHVRPDADGLGSQLALADALRSMGKKPRVVIASPLPPRYEFLDPDRTVVEQFVPPGDEFKTCDAVLVMDTGTWNQLDEFGPYLRSLTVPKAVLDHHRTQDDLGGLAVVDTTAEATGRLTYDLIVALGAPVSAAAAHNLFMALALDTGWFRHPNATADTFALAEKLVRLGANPTPLYERLFEAAPLNRLKLTGLALARLAVTNGGRVGYLEVYLSDYAEAGAVPGDTEDLINYPRSILGVDVAAIFIEQPAGGTKVSLRARNADVSKVAEKFGGGGHKLAAGARVERPLPETRDAVLAEIASVLERACSTR